ncbi:hypothetical protein TRIATDRAFT_217465 [Trichoderma atroviride IMI 206040]|uniref:FAD-binding PCMH-type domain-containing protein n=1 Tax=Hypocrea atroviridis (strain ATCC 20476 / IMI 206040) TaxID=452589 RepID=G9NR76_HYPAI|nr:uncharacterized protein TRIATDRAFT_217465 [Trichoderma atroviride IMI 206040]EHK47045.1 hypothetical protein TRIATDRAFT_217465 [Trichoderma atroviride IMI 206040]
MFPKLGGLLASTLAVFPFIESCSPVVPHYFRAADVSRTVTLAQVQNDLGKFLSKGTQIFGPSSPNFANATDRWAQSSMPANIEVVIEVAQEADVAKIVRYCYQNSIDFLTYNRGHGLKNTLAKFQGIQINLSQLTGITIQPDRNSALFQGGVYADIVIDTLWEQGYIVSQYGLISDDFLSLNVVLANGTTVAVDSSSHSDLFWAMKGAGHNFGIVTSAYIKIYPKVVSTWHYHNYVWSQQQLETVFEALNKFQGKGQIPALMGVNFGQFSIYPTINATEAILTWSFAYDGPAAAAEELLAPFNAIPNISSTMGDVDYADLLVAQGTDSNSASCQPGPFVGSSAWLQTYNVTSQRQIYNSSNEKIAQNPGLAAGARVFLEGYSTEATQAIDPGTSAYPHRDEYLLVFILVATPPSLVSFSQAWADETLALWRESEPGRRPTTYINYAVGNEPLESIYGYAGQLPKLRALKAKYDPQNKFRWYNPVVTD